MSPSPSSSDGNFHADTVGTIARRRSLNLAPSESDGIPLLSSDLHFVAANEGFATRTGYPRGELLGEHVSVLCSDEEIERLNREIARRPDLRTPIPVELSVQPQQGDPIECPARVSGLSTETGLQGSLDVARSDNVTRLPPHESSAESKDVLNSIGDLFSVVDSVGRFQRWNESVRSVTGYSDDEIAAMGPLGPIAREDRERVADSIDETLKTGNGRVEASLRTKRGDNIPIEFAVSTIEMPGGETMIAGIGREISAREKRQQRLEASNERLEQFAYAASHDLREPLRMVSSYLELLEERYGDALDEDGREFLDFAVDGADRMSEMIDGLLACSRIESEAESFEPVELDGVVADVREDLQLLSDEHQATITVDPLPRVTGDRGQLCQLFQNLLDNAMTHGGDAPPRIHISAERDGARWLLSVRDEGVGIDSPDADRIFEAFHALDGPNESGSGIGLALCKRIVERHGGDICVDSSPAEGTTFSFTLPTVGDDRD